MARLRGTDRPFVPTEADLFGGAGGPSGEARGGTGGRTGVEERHDGEASRARHARVALPRRWVRLPRALVSARWQPRGASVAGVVVICVLVGAILGVRVAWARSADTATVIAPGGGSRAGPVPTALEAGPGPSLSASASPSPSTASGVAQEGAPPAVASVGADVVVHVVGQVHSPGVLRLPVGSRVSDAVAGAGGATARADLSGINLARLLQDGEQVRVPAPGEEVREPAAPGGNGSVGGAGAGGSPGGGGSAGAGGVVPLNTADLATLDTLPGVGPVLAQRILDWRAEHGRFAAVDELSEVSGIGEKLLARLRPLVSV